MIKVNIVNDKVVIPRQGKKSYIPNTVLKNDSIKKCIDFGINMAYGTGHHNAYSFAGKTNLRSNKEIFINTVQGKIAELAFYNAMYKLGTKPDKMPDFGVWGKGVWEDSDFEFSEGKKKVSLKSTKSFGNLLLLEKNRYNNSGEYLEPATGNIPIQHDFIVLARVRGVDYADPSLYVPPFNIDCELTGFITHESFVEVISKNQFIKKGTTLGIPLIVDNYYVVANDLVPINQLPNFL